MNIDPSLRADLAFRTVILHADLVDGMAQAAAAVAGFASRGARVAILTGLGRPASAFSPSESLKPLRAVVEAASGVRTSFVGACLGPFAAEALTRTPHGEAALMENLHMHPERRRDTRAFAQKLALLGDFFVDAAPSRERPLAWLPALAALLPAPGAELRPQPRRVR